MTTLAELTLETTEHITLLDVYSDSGVAQISPRVDALATISAGHKPPNAKAPTINRDGTISLHDPEGRATGLAATLNATERKLLTIAFPLDDWNSVVQMRFAEYSASRLLAYGDEKGITTIGEKGERQLHPAGTPEFTKLKARCKVTVNVYFGLAAWNLPGAGLDGREGPGVIFPDGLGFYRLRFTSRNSVQNLLNTWQLIKKLSGGRIAGVPLDLQLVNREVSGPDGSRRNVPVWTFTMKPPQGLSLSSRNFQATLGQALQAGQDLVLPPLDEDVLDAAFSLPMPDQDEPLNAREQRELTSGFNADRMRREYFAITDGTPYRERPGRAELVHGASAAYYQGDTEQATDSLSAVLNRADQGLADYVLSLAQDWVNSWRAERLDAKGVSDLTTYVQDRLPQRNTLAFARETLNITFKRLEDLTRTQARTVCEAARDQSKQPTT